MRYSKIVKGKGRKEKGSNNHTGGKRMYLIDSRYEQPDIQYMMETTKGLMEEGIPIQDLEEIKERLEKDKSASEENLRDLYDINNPNSPAQIIKYFRGRINEDIVEACYRGNKWTTDKQAMAELAVKGYQEAIHILTYRKIKNYLENVVSILNNKHADGRIRPTVTLGKTNRANYSEPALMNIPSDLLLHIIAPRKKGNRLISVDIKNQEPWLMIHMLGIESIKEIMGQYKSITGGKIALYEAVFYEIFGRECTPIERRELKISWNAMTYGASRMGVNAICRNADGDKIYDFFSSIPEFKKYKARASSMARKGIQEVDTYFGTTLVANERGRRLSRVLMDIPIQGTAADILAILIKHFESEVALRGLKDLMSILYTRFDEFIIEVDNELVEHVGMDTITEILADIFEHKVDDWEPFQVEIEEAVAYDIFGDNQVFVDEE